MLWVYTGNGKGKTTAAIGQIVRALGRNLRVCLIQLFKGKEFYGEQKILGKLKNLDFYSFAPSHPFCFPDTKIEGVKLQCEDALECLKKALKKKKRYDLIVLEEFNIAIRDGYLKQDDLFKMLDKNKDIYVLITGRGAPKELIDRADLVTEMKEIKHPYNKGVKAKKGIEF
ncbi:MAG: cob(I)yrinic acid a,c-diamide adenosyltransferase [Elusimicrobia bacterium]|nr:cob(I)yrinic acid a,c-diamide adenosyltransferase [Candidatus Liberimonas magnetica]